MILRLPTFKKTLLSPEALSFCGFTVRSSTPFPLKSLADAECKSSLVIVSSSTFFNKRPLERGIFKMENCTGISLLKTEAPISRFSFKQTKKHQKNPSTIHSANCLFATVGKQLNGKQGLLFPPTTNKL